jgi:hypothetical protein
LNFNLNNLYSPIKDSGCPQLFPFGKWGVVGDKFLIITYFTFFSALLV